VNRGGRRKAKVLPRRVRRPMTEWAFVIWRKLREISPWALINNRRPRPLPQSRSRASLKTIRRTCSHLLVCSTRTTTTRRLASRLGCSLRGLTSLQCLSRAAHPSLLLHRHHKSLRPLPSGLSAPPSHSHRYRNQHSKPFPCRSHPQQPQNLQYPFQALLLPLRRHHHEQCRPNLPRSLAQLPRRRLQHRLRPACLVW
jgi:hypothetical protein